MRVLGVLLCTLCLGSCAKTTDEILRERQEDICTHRNARAHLGSLGIHERVSTDFALISFAFYGCRYWWMDRQGLARCEKRMRSGDLVFYCSRVCGVGCIPIEDLK